MLTLKQYQTLAQGWVIAYRNADEVKLSREIHRNERGGIVWYVCPQYGNAVHIIDLILDYCIAGLDWSNEDKAAMADLARAYANHSDVKGNL